MKSWAHTWKILIFSLCAVEMSWGAIYEYDHSELKHWRSNASTSLTVFLFSIRTLYLLNTTIFQSAFLWYFIRHMCCNFIYTPSESHFLTLSFVQCFTWHAITHAFAAAANGTLVEKCNVKIKWIPFIEYYIPFGCVRTDKNLKPKKDEKMRQRKKNPPIFNS